MDFYYLSLLSGANHVIATRWLNGQEDPNAFRLKSVGADHRKFGILCEKRKYGNVKFHEILQEYNSN